MIKEPIQEEDITIINIYSLNIGAPQYIRQMLTDINPRDRGAWWAADCGVAQS